MKNKGLISDGLWVASGQLLSAIGTLIGLRALTEYVSPSIYGSITLLLAASNLALGTLFTPIMQAAIKYYSHYHSSNRFTNFRYTALFILTTRLFPFILILASCWPIVDHYKLVSLDEYSLLIFIFLLDGIRSFETVLLNAARQQKSYALISLIEAWGRPFMAVLIITTYGASIFSVLLGYASTTLLVLLFFYLLANPVRKHAYQPSKVDTKLKSEIVKYSLPLLPLATVGWLSGVGDRYIIAGTLGMEDVGIYAAVYGLLNRPFMMLGSTIELTLRPLYNQAIAEGKDQKAHFLLMKWLFVVFFSASLGWSIVTIFKDFWISIFLAEAYKQGEQLMPWIAGGSAILILSHVFEKVCYGYGRTGLILITQTFGALIGLVGAYIGVTNWGIQGAAIAAPIYFGIQLIISFIAANTTRKLRI